jgi:hypothetical protein
MNRVWIVLLILLVIVSSTAGALGTYMILDSKIPLFDDNSDESDPVEINVVAPPDEQQQEKQQETAPPPKAATYTRITSFSPVNGAVFDTDSIRFANAVPDQCAEACNKLGDTCVGYKFDRASNVCNMVQARTTRQPNDVMHIKTGTGYKRMIGYAPYNVNTWFMHTVDSLDNETQCLEVCKKSVSIPCEGIYYNESYNTAGTNIQMVRTCKLFSYPYSGNTDMYTKDT